MRVIKVLILLFVFHHISVAQITKIEPPFWYSDMKNDTLQLMIYGKKIGQAVSVTTEEKGIKVLEIHSVENPNYLFIDVLNNRNDAFTVDFKIKGERLNEEFKFEFKKKKEVTRGFSSEDLIYLIMSDRFANGDPSNDSSPSLLEKADRSNPDGRHGGDIQGVIDHLDYLSDLGVTALWMTPFLENNMKDYSYHGYSTTDYYKSDARMGSNEKYKELSVKARDKDIKLIMDIVLNHIGSNHWWMDDLPSSDWLNHNDGYITNYRAATMADPYASESDTKRMVEGWFVSTMPDLNQKNPFLATYLEQAALWWIEYAELSGFRVDTQPYVYKEFMSEWSLRIKEEYPDFTILGESWLQRPALTSYYEGKKSKDYKGYNSHTDVVTDFPMHFALKGAMLDEQSFTGGIASIYYILMQDFLYDDPMNNVVFMDNHDLTRLYTTLGEDLNKLKMATTLIFTTRGIPILYYGTEALSSGNEHDGHGFIRKDLIGGWKGDETSIFNQQGLTEDQIDYYNYVKTLANWRKGNEAVKKGTLVHFIPENNVYVYFREYEDKASMIIINNDDEAVSFSMDRFKEITGKYTYSAHVFNLQISPLEDDTIISVPAQSSAIYTLSNMRK